MSAPENRNTGKLTTGNQETSTIEEKSEMKATANGQTKLTVACQEISKFKEDIAMKLSMMITKNTPVKILGGLAVGALLLGATALTQGTNNPVTGKLNIGPTAVTLGGGITDFEEPYVNAVRSTSEQGGGITDFEEPYINAVRAANDLGGGITDLEEPYVNAVRSTSDLGGGITDFEEPYVNAVRSSSDLGGGITDFEEPYVNAVRSSSDLSGGITDFEESYVNAV